ncbi:MAG TPA: hypothetical protein PKA79_07085 [Oligoflexia bacterium]|nr:hypothetical protein [Oligoflexia bacterium]
MSKVAGGASTKSVHESVKFSFKIIFTKPESPLFLTFFCAIGLTAAGCGGGER